MLRRSSSGNGWVSTTFALARPVVDSRQLADGDVISGLSIRAEPSIKSGWLAAQAVPDRSEQMVPWGRRLVVVFALGAAACVADDSRTPLTGGEGVLVKDGT